MIWTIAYALLFVMPALAVGMKIYNAALRDYQVHELDDAIAVTRYLALQGDRQ